MQEQNKSFCFAFLRILFVTNISWIKRNRELEGNRTVWFFFDKFKIIQLKSQWILTGNRYSDQNAELGYFFDKKNWWIWCLYF